MSGLYITEDDKTLIKNDEMIRIDGYEDVDERKQELWRMIDTLSARLSNLEEKLDVK